MDEMISGYTRNDLEVLRMESKQKFDERRAQWVEQLLWTVPHRAKWLLGANDNDNPMGYPIADGTHILAQRSMTAGFLEGNTSASRPWIRYAHPDPDRDRFPANRAWLDLATNRSLSYLSNSNYYHQAAQFYYDFGSVDTGCHVFKRGPRGIHVFTLMPGQYFVINNALDEPEVLVREFSLHALALVKRYGKKKNGSWDWSNFTPRVKDLFEKSNTTVKIEVVEIILRNKDFDTNQPIGGRNREWTSITYETGVQNGGGWGQYVSDPYGAEHKNLEVSYYRRRPFIVGKAFGDTYGEWGPTTNAIGLIRSINKKAISADIAIEKILDPTTQSPAHIRKSYLTLQARKNIPLDATAAALGGVKTVYEMNSGIVALTQNVEQIQRQVEKFYYADFLLFLSNNPKTRTATEAQGVIDEQRSVLGPNLQSLNWSYNMPISEYMLDFIIHEDPFLPPPPEDLQGEPINTEFISVFAQVQKAFDLPQINQFVDRWVGLAQLNPQAWNNIDLTKLAAIYENRYNLPAGLNNPKSLVEDMMRRAQQQQNQQRMIEALPAAAQASKQAAEARQISQQSQGDANAV